jgi:hypothetical protein
MSKKIVVVQDIRMGKAISDHLNFCCDIESDIYTYNEMKGGLEPPYKSYSGAIIDVYNKKSDGKIISSGLELADTLFKLKVPSILFYSYNGIYDSKLMDDYSENIFYLPNQIKEFLINIEKNLSLLDVKDIYSNFFTQSENKH